MLLDDDKKKKESILDVLLLISLNIKLNFVLVCFKGNFYLWVL